MDFKECRRVSLDQDSIQPNAQNANTQYAAYHCTLATSEAVKIANPQKAKSLSDTLLFTPPAIFSHPPPKTY